MSGLRAVSVPPLADRRVLVVGATGFIGSRLVPALAGAGAHVTGVSRFAAANGVPTRIRLGSIVSIPCDASDPRQVSDLFAAAKPSLVYLLTSDSRGGRELDLIADGLRNDIMASVHVLVEAARVNAHVVFAGSFEEPVPVAGEDPVPCSPYAAAKWASAGYARMISALHGLPVTMLRLMMTYGPGQKEHKVIPYVIKRLLAGEPASVSPGLRLLDWVYVDDVVDALVEAATRGFLDTRSIDIGTGHAAPLREVLSLIGTLMGRRELVRFGHMTDRPMERQEAADTKVAERLLGWRATTSIEDGLRRTIDFYSEGSTARHAGRA